MAKVTCLRSKPWVYAVLGSYSSQSYRSQNEIRFCLVVLAWLGRIVDPNVHFDPNVYCEPECAF